VLQALLLHYVMRLKVSNHVLQALLLHYVMRLKVLQAFSASASSVLRLNAGWVCSCQVFLFDVATRRWLPDPAYSHLLDDGWNWEEVGDEGPGGGGLRAWLRLAIAMAPTQTRLSGWLL